MGLRSNLLLSVLDQGVVSATNFGVALLLVYLAPKESYGLYALGFGLITLVTSIGHALVVTPMTVNAPRLEVGAQDAYCKSLLASEALAAFLIAGLVGTVVGVAMLTGLVELDDGLFWTAIAFAGAGVLLHEFFRRFFFLKGNARNVLIMDFALGLGFLSALAVGGVSGLERMHTWAIVFYGTSAGLIALFVARTGALPAFAGWSQSRRNLLEAWTDGRWALAGVTVTWVQSQAYAYVLAVMLGTASLAEANAARLLFAPVAMLGTGLMNAVMPESVKRKARGDGPGAERVARRMLAVLLLLTGLYTVAVAGGQRALVGWVLPEDYAGVGPYVLTWAAVVLLQAVRANSSMLLQVFRQFRAITVANAWTALLVVVLTPGLIHFYGVGGGISALGVGELALGLLLWRAFSHVRRFDAG